MKQYTQTHKKIPFKVIDIIKMVRVVTSSSFTLINVKISTTIYIHNRHLQ